MPEFFKMGRIAPLIRDMASHGAKQDSFTFMLKNVTFDVIILIDRSPFELLFGVLDHNFAFTLRMYEGYKLEYPTDQVYYRLCDILQLTYSEDEFSSTKFLQYVVTHLPNGYSGRSIQPHEVAVHMVNDVTYNEDIDESDKIYFKGWVRHDTDNRSARNFAKTKRLLGNDAYKFCVANNISSKWSNSPHERTDYISPQDYMLNKCK